MTRALWFAFKLAVLVAAAVWLAERPGHVAVAWQGYVLETSFGVGVLALAAALVITALVYRLLRGVWTAPSRFGRWLHSRRRERGYRALTQGMVAVAAGDAATARRMARRADGLLNEPPLTMLLSAQAAQLGGDDEAARRYFEAMLERPETRFLGLRGLLTQALRRGDRVEALGLARRAREMQPETPWLLATVYDLEARSGGWTEADSALQHAVQAGALNPEDGRHHRAALLLERSFEAERQGRGDDALGHAQAAHDLLPGFVPAAARLARLLARQGQVRSALKAIGRCWRAHPHPELADAARDVMEGQQPAARIREFQKFTAYAPAHMESHLALARAAMDAGQWSEARAHLNQAIGLQPSRRVYGLFAELETAEKGDDDAARTWLADAGSAPPDPAWTCRACGQVAPAWAGLCGNCGSFDTMDWKTPTLSLHLPAVTGSGANGSTLPTVIEAAR